MDNWDDIIDFQNKMSDYVDKIKKEEHPKSLFDVGVEMKKENETGRRGLKLSGRTFSSVAG